MGYKFSFIEFKRKTIPDKDAPSYKIYKNPQEYVIIEAQTAYEAMKASGIELPYKLERTGLTKKSVFLDSELR